ncbi:phosphatase PAP2 family protein [Oceaniglobus ichthyenteri]|uniref:phosphatase PAP2 family protein n=1 Tax=Oceaniglobus ichthyenteri TaxID=2136177 RepID=UPI000D36D711|nr:phosphatase PAP2 family protein [Oceaniglobus ichthyenteri]
MKLNVNMELIRRFAPNGQIIALGFVAAAVWGFSELAEAVIGNETRSFDTNVILMLRSAGDPSDPIGPSWIEELGRDITALGGTGVLTFLTLAVSGFLWLRGERRSMVFLLLSVGTGIALSTALKLGFDRPRPDLVPHGSAVYTASFPSGHSLMAALVYLTLAVLVMRTVKQRRMRAYLAFLAVLVVVSVGISRVYMGVHWPTDVLAGWTVGAGWAIFCALVATWLERRGQIDPEVPF